MKIYFLDVGQGDAIYVRTPGGRDMLIDGGPGTSVLRKLSEVMPWYDRKIDVVIGTHPDADHIGGLPDVLKRYEVGVFLEPGIESKNLIDDEVRRVRSERSVESIIARRGMRINFGDGAYFDVLYPDKDVSGLKDTNDASIVGEMTYGSTSAMFTGDSPKSVESYLVGIDGERLDADILKVGHHGSRTSTGEVYLKFVTPDYAVVSAGRNNRYGHPHKEVTEEFKMIGVPVLSTADLGTIEFLSDGEKFVRK